MSFEWSTANLGVLVPGDEPVSLRYGDYSRDRQSIGSYTTIIALHGTGFNSNIWTPWLPHLPPDIRLIVLNRRGYAGSSPLHQSRKMLPCDTESYGRDVFDVFAFIKFVADILDVPQSSVAGNAGGIVLLGWSKGCAYLTSLLAVLASDNGLPASHGISRSALKPYIPVMHTYVKTVLLFEPPGVMAGIPQNVQLYDATLSPAQLGRGFVDGCLTTVPSEMKKFIEPAIDDTTVAAHELQTWNGTDDLEREGVAIHAFSSIPSWLGVGVMCCAGTTIDTCIRGSQWMIDRCTGQVNTTSRVIPGGNHFVMATDPGLFNEAVISTIAELATKIDSSARPQAPEGLFSNNSQGNNRAAQIVAHL